MDAPDQKNGGHPVCRVSAGKRRANTSFKAPSPSDTPRRGFGRARRLQSLILLAARAALGVVRGEPRVFGRDLGIDAGERRAELVPVRLQGDDLVDEALAPLRS